MSAIYASLLSHSHAGRDAEQLITDKVLSRTLFDSLQKLIDASSANAHAAKSPREVGEDPEMFVEMAKIWHGESLERAVKAYRSAAQLRSQGGEKASPQLTNNLAALAQLDGDLATAETMYKEALESTEGEEGNEVGAMKTTLLYNLGRAYEGQGKLAEAKEAYQRILTIHPEYSDG